MAGQVIGVYVGGEARGPLVSVDEVRAEPGRGLEGDRYWKRQGTFWKAAADREVTLIESEVLESLAAEAGITIEGRDARRNLATRGVRLNELVNRRFRVGEVTLAGIRLCEPCSHLEQLAGRPLRPLLAGRGGLRAGIVTGGVIRVGDAIQIEAEGTPEEDRDLAAVPRQET
jgi:MOSC domain-containing protein YiiM